MITAPPSDLMQALELMKSVDDFYRSSFETLLWFAAALFAVLGLVFPLVIQWLQRVDYREHHREQMKATEDRLTGFVANKLADLDKALRSDTQALTAAQATALSRKIEEGLGAARAELAATEERMTKAIGERLDLLDKALRTNTEEATKVQAVELSGKIEKGLGQMRSTIAKQADFAMAGIYHVQALLLRSQNAHPQAVGSMMVALGHYLKADAEEKYVETAIGVISKDPLLKAIKGLDIEDMPRFRKAVNDASRVFPNNQALQEGAIRIMQMFPRSEAASAGAPRAKETASD